MKGKLITLEGSEGSGKSTQVKLIYEYLKAKKVSVLFVREPGGVKISEAIRTVLLDVNNKNMNNECETLLYMAARAQLVQEVILPALKKGTIILSDRFLDSTIAYQGFGNGVNIKLIKLIGAFATQGIKPDLTFLFDIDITQGLSRTNAVKDRIELRSVGYHTKVRRGYLALAKENPRRIKVIRVDKSKEEIFKVVQKHLVQLLKIKN